MLPHVSLFTGVVGKGIGARKIGDPESIILVIKGGLLGAHCYTGIISRVLMGTGNPVKKGGFPTVGVSHKCHINDPVGPGHHWSFLNTVSNPRQRRSHRPGKLRLARNHLDQFCLTPAQRHIAVHNAIFHRVLQRSRFYNFHLLTPDKSHLCDPLLKCTPPPDPGDDGSVACMQVVQCHLFSTFPLNVYPNPSTVSLTCESLRPSA